MYNLPNLKHFLSQFWHFLPWFWHILFHFVFILLISSHYPNSTKFHGLVTARLLSMAGASSVGNSHRSTSPRPTTLEEGRELFVDFSSILCLWFEIWDSIHEDLQLFWLSFKHWVLQNLVTCLPFFPLPMEWEGNIGMALSVLCPSVHPSVTWGFSSFADKLLVGLC